MAKVYNDIECKNVMMSMWAEFISKNDLVKKQYKNVLLEKGLDEQEIKEYFEDLDVTCHLKKL